MNFKKCDFKLFSFKVKLSILFTVVAFIGCQSSWQIDSPYNDIDWEQSGQYKANLHTHTTVRGGWMNPQTTVEKYRERGYKILAITDHFSVTYPWEEFSKFNPDDRTRRRVVEKVPKPDEEETMKEDELEFKDVRPSAVGMVAIQGNEVSYLGHDVNSFYNDYNSRNSKETLDVITTKGGLAVLNHPGRYDFPVEWYVDEYKRYNHLVGFEVFNCGNRYPNDRRLWDSILTVIAPVRPVWGFSNDDMHSMRDFGRNWNVFILPELTDELVRRAIEKGVFYFVNAPQGHDGSVPPKIESININQRKAKIEINATKHDSIVWIADGEKICKGNKVLLNNLNKEINYVRAEVYGAGNSVVCTQPFIVKKSK